MTDLPGAPGSPERRKAALYGHGLPDRPSSANHRPPTATRRRPSVIKTVVGWTGIILVVSFALLAIEGILRTAF